MHTFIGIIIILVIVGGIAVYQNNKKAKNRARMEKALEAIAKKRANEKAKVVAAEAAAVVKAVKKTKKVKKV